MAPRKSATAKISNQSATGKFRKPRVKREPKITIEGNPEEDVIVDVQIFPIDPIEFHDGCGHDIIYCASNHPVVVNLRSPTLLNSLAPVLRAQVSGVVDYVYNDLCPNIKTKAEAEDLSSILLALNKIFLLKNDADITERLYYFLNGDTTLPSLVDTLSKELSNIRFAIRADNLEAIENSGRGGLAAAIREVSHGTNAMDLRGDLPALFETKFDKAQIASIINSFDTLALS